MIDAPQSQEQLCLLRAGLYCDEIVWSAEQRQEAIINIRHRTSSCNGRKTFRQNIAITKRQYFAAPCHASPERASKTHSREQNNNKFGLVLYFPTPKALQIPQHQMQLKYHLRRLMIEESLFGSLL